MTHTALTPLLGREFDDFLYASIGEDRNGTTLSVLSALARLDVDPWQETASLARMPRERATERMTAVIAAVRKDLATSLAPETIAARLIALLPQAAPFSVAAPAALLKTGSLRSWRFFCAADCSRGPACHLLRLRGPPVVWKRPRLDRHDSRNRRAALKASARGKVKSVCAQPFGSLARQGSRDPRRRFPLSTSLQTSAAQRLTASLSAASAWRRAERGARVAGRTIRRQPLGFSKNY